MIFETFLQHANPSLASEWFVWALGPLPDWDSRSHAGVHDGLMMNWQYEMQENYMHTDRLCTVDSNSEYYRPILDHLLCAWWKYDIGTRANEARDWTEQLVST